MITRTYDDHEARVLVIARALPNDVDLDDDGDVIRALFLARYCAADFDCVLDEVIERARFNREWNKAHDNQ